MDFYKCFWPLDLLKENSSQNVKDEFRPCKHGPALPTSVPESRFEQLLEIQFMQLLVLNYSTMRERLLQYTFGIWLFVRLVLELFMIDWRNWLVIQKQHSIWQHLRKIHINKQRVPLFLHFPRVFSEETRRYDFFQSFHHALFSHPIH